MTAKTTHIISAAGALRLWIIGGLGALILLVIFMIQPPASASHAASAASRPCATPASQSHKCPPCPPLSGGCRRAAEPSPHEGGGLAIGRLGGYPPGRPIARLWPAGLGPID